MPRSTTARVITPMVIDTGATSVVLTWETAKATIGSLEMLEYDVDVETAGGHTAAAMVDTRSPSAVGTLVEKLKFRRWSCRAGR